MKKKRSKPNLIVGFLVLALALVGCVSLVITAMKSIDKTISDKNAEKYGKYEEFIAPVIMNDPDTFDDVTVADPGQLMSIAIFSGEHCYMVST